ncbi:MAG: Calx-beta domain-containing protein, partial [bacterium]
MSVRYRSVGSSAREGVHFKSTSGRLVWPEGDNSDRTISVKLLNDNDFSPFVDVNTFSLVLEDITFSNGGLSAQAYKGPPTAYANVLVAEDDGFGLLGLERTHLTVD